ncbi:PepSY domain-containing protein [Elizabethkingia sp. JS20170427COW]|uniref:PepSY-associated TM helix domain-containing protein n=1 Tax=Elizabethkingia sp. JS20170427COW TaxID=2583851 RepID=UPI001110454B|nr:PepSY domain-containing protein [Elizabethkingia sp. JS20170427COW]QCX53736.1 PepSY domain-containing protein [Elizabethkingia sp. JS20170427COW]
MEVKTAKRWFNWHKWTSLICTVFLLLLCLTGLPLIFHEEIEHLTSSVEATVPENAQKLPLDELKSIAEKANPGKFVRYIFWDDEHSNQLLLDVVKRPDVPFTESKYLVLNEYTGEILDELKDEGFMSVMLHLHVDLFAGIPGKLFLGLMGILFLISIVTGIVLYGRIMKKFDFGMIRKNKSSRLKWLDTHNFLGIAVTLWMLVVGFTGVINTLSDVITYLWQQDQLAEMTAPYKNEKPISGPLSSLDQAKALVEKEIPDMRVSVIAFPGTDFSSKHHYAIFLKGTTPLTSRLLKPALVDASNGTLTATEDMPWYVTSFFISEPLHFGDYGGLTLKIIWAVFDVITIIILITGLYLWIARRKAEKEQWTRIQNMKL